MKCNVNNNAPIPKLWTDSPDPAVGWCNINNPDIPQLWAARWKK